MFYHTTLVLVRMYSIFSIILILFIINSNCLHLRKSIEYERNEKLSRLISSFSNNHLLFHYDNTTKYIVEYVISKPYIVNNTALLYNYDEDISSAKISRPTGYKYLHIVLLGNNTRFKEYASSDVNAIRHIDIVLMILNYVHDKPIENLQNVGTLFLINLQNLRVYTVCFYCGNLSYHWNYIAKLKYLKTHHDYQHLKQILMNIYLNQFKDFNRHTFNIGYINYKPYIWIK